MNNIDIKTTLIELYVEWFNDYLTVEKIAEHKGLELADMQALINIGQKLANEK
jgi:hypothetical protein